MPLLLFSSSLLVFFLHYMYFAHKQPCLNCVCGCVHACVCVPGGVVLLDGAAAVSGHGGDLVELSGGEGHSERRAAGERRGRGRSSRGTARSTSFYSQLLPNILLHCDSLPFKKHEGDEEESLSNVLASHSEAQCAVAVFMLTSVLFSAEPNNTNSVIQECFP